MKTGIKGEACTYVNSENTAAAMKSGTLDAVSYTHLPYGSVRIKPYI